MNKPTTSSWFDAVGVFLAGTCMIHCLLLPLTVAVFPLLNDSVLSEDQFHLILLVVILPTSVAALLLGAWRHGDIKTITLGGVALVTLVVTALMGHTWFGYTGERIITTVAGLLLATAHVLNYRRSRHVHAG